MKHNKEELQQEDIMGKSSAEAAAEYSDEEAKIPVEEGNDAAEGTEDKEASEYNEQLLKEVEELKKQSEENFNRFVRMQADFENYKKRVAREREEMYYSSLETIVSQILPVIDNMERAVAAFRADNLDSKYVEGVEMVLKQLIDVLGKNGVKEIEALDMDFDPNLHHAVMRAEEEGKEDNKITEVFQKGYLLGNKVIRPSLVKVNVKS